MIEEIKTIKDLEVLFNKKNVFDVLNVKEIGVFGSLARGEKFNDIDLLVDSEKQGVETYEFFNSLKEAIGKEIDLVFYDLANPIILHRAKKDLKYVRKS